MPYDLGDYVEVAKRIDIFRSKYPDGSLQSTVLRWPADGFPFVAVQAWAYRTPDDVRPGIGLAWELVPGKTNYTRDSELMNAETSAWGRAIVAVLAADTKKGIASANEVRRGKQSVGPAEAHTAPVGLKRVARENAAGTAGPTSSEAHTSERSDGSGAAAPPTSDGLPGPSDSTSDGDDRLKAEPPSEPGGPDGAEAAEGEAVATGSRPGLTGPARPEQVIRVVKVYGSSVDARKAWATEHPGAVVPLLDELPAADLEALILAKVGV